MKVARNDVTKLLGNPQRRFEHKKFFKIPSFTIFFIFLVLFTSFFFLFHLSILVKIFWKLLWCFHVCIRDLSKNSRKFGNFVFKNIKILRRLCAPNRSNRVDTTSVESRNRCCISSWALLRLVFYVSDLFINRCSICKYYVGYRTDVKSPRLSTSPTSMSVLEPM